MVPHDDLIALSDKLTKRRGVIGLSWVSIGMVKIDRCNQRKIWGKRKKISVKFVALIDKVFRRWIELTTRAKANTGADRVAHRNAELMQCPDRHGRRSSLAVSASDGDELQALLFDNDIEQLVTLGSAYAKLLGSYYTTKVTGVSGKINSYQLGADVPMGAALTLSVGYASSKATGGKSASGVGLAAAYNLSKRTMLYGGLRAANDVAGNDFWAVGVNHKF